MAGDPRSVAGQARIRPLAETLNAAQSIAEAARVTRLADLSGLDPIGLPVWQAVRPDAACLSVTLGKGLTHRAAMTSALMEAIEIDVAERVRGEGPALALAELAQDQRRLWSEAARPACGIRLDLHRPREWMEGVDLRTGCPVMIPLDLVSMDFTRPIAPDAGQNSVGLASGNSRAEALVGAVAELVEHHLVARWREDAVERRQRCEIDLDTIDDPLIRRPLARIAAAGRRAQLWCIGGEEVIPAFESIVTERRGTDTDLPPARGSACHPDRTVAALGAILEAVQARAAMIAGARDDFAHDDYRDGARRTLDMMMATILFDHGRLAWSEVPTFAGTTPEDNLAVLLDSAARLSPLPVVAVELDPPHPRLHVVKALAPGLESILREGAQREPAVPTIVPRRARRREPILFAGPSLAGVDCPTGIEVRPPAIVGDLAALMGDPPVAVGLVDGCFEIAPSVWHKEILDLLACGTAVFGAASLGAIRAAELHMSGMVGVGAIFRAYRDGQIRRDDAVMIAHAPAELGHRPLTVALVDAESALRDIDLPAGERRMLQRIARTMPFRQRTWAAILDVYRQRAGRPATVTLPMLAALPSLKQRDAIELVEALRGPIAPPPPRSRPPLTRPYRALLATITATPPTPRR